VPIFKVSYASMTARYGPSFIEADSPEDAKRKFGRGAFTPGEQAICMTAREVSAKEVCAALDEEESD